LKRGIHLFLYQPHLEALADLLHVLALAFGFEERPVGLEVGGV